MELLTPGSSIETDQDKLPGPDDANYQNCGILHRKSVVYLRNSKLPRPDVDDA